MKIAFLCRPPTGPASLTVQVAELLEEWGAVVELIHPEAEPVLRRDHDLYVLRTVNAQTLRYAAALDALGAVVVNPYPVSRLCTERRQVAALLRRAGVAVTQSRLEGEADRKLYSIGGQLFGVRRPRPATTDEQKFGEPFTITPELRWIALRVGRVIGADLYGIDIGQVGGRFAVVDVHAFPGFKGVPQAPLRVADYIWAAAVSALERIDVVGGAR